MRVLAFTRYGREAASTRYRLLQFLPALAEAGIAVEWQPLLGDDHVRALVTGERPSRASIAAAYARRLSASPRALEADLLWVYAELLPYVPGFLETLALPRGVPVVVDWDDAFHVPLQQHRNPLVRRLLGRKFEPLLRRAAAVTCGNPWVADYAGRFCARTEVIPTVVDMHAYRPAETATGGAPVIGWIGSPSTWCNVQPLLSLLRRLHNRHGIVFRAIGAGRAAEADLFPGLELVDWSEASEIAEVQGFTIGIMPLLDLPFQRGKSGFKLIQYMACGLPVVASPVGVNGDIVDHGRNGLLATSEAEWEAAIERLLGDPELRRSAGAQGRRTAVERYSLASQAPRLVALFREVAAAR